MTVLHPLSWSFSFLISLYPSMSDPCISLIFLSAWSTLLLHSACFGKLKSDSDF